MGSKESVSAAQNPHSGSWVQGWLSSPSWWPHFPAQIRQAGARWPAWEWLRPGPRQASRSPCAMPSFQGSSGGAWAPVGPRDIVSVFPSFPRGTRGGACKQDPVTSPDTEVPSVTETQERQEEGSGLVPIRE